MYRYPVIMILLVMAGAALADPCTEACDAEFDADSAACLATYLAVNGACNEAHAYTVSLCNAARLDCEAHCGGDPNCMMMCAEVHYYCVIDADVIQDQCQNDSISDYHLCGDAAEIDHLACLEACALPLNESDWGQIKSMYR